MRDVQFALLREGSSDDGLVTPIRALLIRAGMAGVIGAARAYKGTTKEKLQQVLAEPVVPNLIFVHRDSDSRDPSHRHAEIAEAADQMNCRGSVIGVVPVQETEGWLLTDEFAIRSVVGRPGGKTPLGLPQASHIEATADAKEVLREACRAACEKSGARLKKVSGQFTRHRSTLLERLNIDGPVNELESWQRFVTDLDAAAYRVRSAEG